LDNNEVGGEDRVQLHRCVRSGSSHVQGHKVQAGGRAQNRPRWCKNCQGWYQVLCGGCDVAARVRQLFVRGAAQPQAGEVMTMSTDRALNDPLQIGASSVVAFLTHIFLINKHNHISPASPVTTRASHTAHRTSHVARLSFFIKVPCRMPHHVAPQPHPTRTSLRPHVGRQKIYRRMVYYRRHMGGYRG
jgi:hypothetical protein